MGAVKLHVVSFVLFWIAVAGISSSVLAQSEVIVLDNRNEFVPKQRPPVVFPHETHMMLDVECLDCHHDYDNNKNILDENILSEENEALVRCVRCHNKESKYDLRDAFHLMCMSCHRKARKTGQKSGPVLCAKCHPWKR
jgi:hypothetical protein